MTVKDTFSIDRLEHVGDYAALGAGFALAAEFLLRKDLDAIAPGRYELDGDRVIAIVNGAADLVAPSARKVEVHHDYFDIQVPRSGEETFGLARFDPSAPGSFDEANDIGFYDQPVEYYTLAPGEFAILHPKTCAHAPAVSLTGPRAIRKIIVKVRA